MRSRRAPRWMTKQRPRVAVSHQHRAEALLAPLPARPGVLLAGAARRPRPVPRAALSERTDSVIRTGYGRPGQDGPLASGDRRGRIPAIDLVAGCDATAYLTDILRQARRPEVLRRFRQACWRARPLDALDRRHAVEAARADGAEGARARPARVLREAVRARLRGRRQSVSPTLARHPWPGDAGGLPLPLRRRLQGSGAARRSRAALGEIHHVRAEAYGPVVLRRKGRHLALGQERGRWRALRLRLPRDRPGQLHCRQVPTSVGGVVRNSVFSRDVDDEVYSTMQFANGASGQLCVNWSDESFRKMSTTISGLGHERAPDRRPPGMPALPARAARSAARHR